MSIELLLIASGMVEKGLLKCQHTHKLRGI